MIEIRHLKYFVVVARELHFTTAAKLLHIAQPALSQNIRQIEEELNVRLLERDSHRVTLTDAGKVFYRDAQSILAAVGSASVAAQRTAQGVSSKLRLGCTATTLLGSLAPIIRKFRSSHSDIHLDICERTVDDLAVKLKSGELDIICTDSEVIDDSFEQFSLGFTPAYCVLHKTHPLAKRRSLRLRDLARENFIWADFEQLHNYSEVAMRRCQMAGFEPNISYFATSIPGAIGMASCNLGVTLCCPSSIYMLPSEHVVARPLTDQRPGCEMQLFWKRNDLNTAGQRFVAIAKDLQKKKSRK